MCQDIEKYCVILDHYSDLKNVLTGLYVIHIEWCHEYLGYPFEGA